MFGFFLSFEDIMKTYLHVRILQPMLPRVQRVSAHWKNLKVAHIYVLNYAYFFLQKFRGGCIHFSQFTCISLIKGV